jgi:hypothetical protein
MRKILGLVLVLAMVGMLVAGCSTTTPEIKTIVSQPKGLTIRGTVYGRNQGDLEGDPLSGVVLFLSGDSASRTTATNSKGEYVFSGVPATGTGANGFNIVATKEGYQRAIRRDIDFGEDTTPPNNSVTTIDIYLNNRPVVNSITPAPGVTIEVSSNFVVAFNEAMDISSVRPSLTAQGVRTYAIGDTSTINTSWSSDHKTLTITPTGNLLPNTNYGLAVDPLDTARDASGNDLDTYPEYSGGLVDTVYNATQERYYHRTASGGFPGAPTGLHLTVSGGGGVVLPANLDYIAIIGGEALLNWHAPTSGGPISGYRVYVSNSSTGPWHLADTIAGNSAAIAVDDVNISIHGDGDFDPVSKGNAAFINYKVYFRVVAYNADGESSAAAAEAQDATGPQLDATAFSGRSLGAGFLGTTLFNAYYLVALTAGTDTKIAYIAFNEPVDPSSITATNFTHSAGTVNSATLLTSYREPLASWTGDVYSIVKIVSSTVFANGHTITAGTGVKDLAGNAVVAGPSASVTIP